MPYVCLCRTPLTVNSNASTKTSTGASHLGGGAAEVINLVYEAFVRKLPGQKVNWVQGVNPLKERNMHGPWTELGKKVGATCVAVELALSLRIVTATSHIFDNCCCT